MMGLSAKGSLESAIAEFVSVVWPVFRTLACFAGGKSGLEQGGRSMLP